MNSFDLMVIGSGSGLEISADAAGRGLSVAVVEEGPFDHGSSFEAGLLGV